MPIFPNPLILKTRSIKYEFAIIAAMTYPIWAANGMIEFLKACSQTTRFSAIPLAKAVRI
jgi:hypothetical protein